VQSDEKSDKFIALTFLRCFMGMKIEASWHRQMQEELSKSYIEQLKKFIAQEKAENKIIYPPESLVFNAFLHTPFDQVKVVIIGQDPYHGPNQAHGLSFSVQSGIPLPPSLKNIFLELEQDLGIPRSQDGCLASWAKQGVLLLNATLTVRAGEPKSHYGQGWERFTDAVVSCLLKRQDPLVFVLWGASAQEKLKAILHDQKTPHAVLTAAHPSPFSAHQGFFGCRHFSKVNALLEKWGKTPIDWRVSKEVH
jgi:uracil-DNA glycosylase